MRSGSEQFVTDAPVTHRCRRTGAVRGRPSWPSPSEVCASMAHVRLAAEGDKIDAADNDGDGMTVAPPFPPPRWLGGEDPRQGGGAGQSACAPALGGRARR
jgi:hypothetical protein